MKNVLAIAAGASDGLGFGDNARAALITRGLAESGRLSAALGGKRETLMGLAGLGDLVLTCTGNLSRNRRVGLALARGQPLRGDPRRARACRRRRAGHPRRARRSRGIIAIDMPIVDAVHRVLYEDWRRATRCWRCCARAAGGMTTIEPDSTARMQCESHSRDLSRHWRC